MQTPSDQDSDQDSDQYSDQYSDAETTQVRVGLFSISSSLYRFCDLVFQGPLSVQEDWIKHLQRHIMNTSVPHTGLSMVEVPLLPTDPSTLETDQDSSLTATHAASWSPRGPLVHWPVCTLDVLSLSFNEVLAKSTILLNSGDIVNVWTNRKS